MIDTTIDFNLKTIEAGHHKMLYRGVKSLKCPFDYVTYQMIINEIKPDLIIEIGTLFGGNTLYIADLLDINKKGEIHTIDIEEYVDSELVINHPRIKKFLGGFQNYDINLTKNFNTILIIDDGSHQYQDVLDAFKKFQSIVSLNSYYIIEDGSLTELGYGESHNGGPLRAIEEIMVNNNEYEIDRKWCDFFGKNATFNTNGFLKKTSFNINKVALISSFCDTQEKIDVLEKNIKIIKEHNLDVILISPLSLPESVLELCDYFFLTKDNPILKFPIRGIYYWRKYNFNEVVHELSSMYPDYGFAGMNQIKQLSEIALNMNYDQFYHIIYDVKIDDNVIEGFYSDKKCNVYPSKRDNTIWKVGLHYMIFDRVNLQNFISHITLEEYLSDSNRDAFSWLFDIKNKVNYEIENNPIEDEIFYYNNHDFLNSSPIENFKFFIEKNEDVVSNIRIYFYGNEGQKDIDIKIGNIKKIHTVKNHDIIDLGFDKLNYQKVIITVDSIEYDISDIIVDITHNVLNIG
jgi:cephalosporin hydroxylase